LGVDEDRQSPAREVLWGATMALAWDTKERVICSGLGWVASFAGAWDEDIVTQSVARSESVWKGAALVGILYVICASYAHWRGTGRTCPILRPGIAEEWFRNDTFCWGKDRARTLAPPGYPKCPDVWW